MPVRYGRYFEPFLGGGALFFALQPKFATLADLNDALIDCYTTVRSNPEAVWERLSRMRNSAEEYYQVRASRPRSEAGRAARIIYLATLSFNGIYRENLAGNFNVPYGHRTARSLPSRAQLISVAMALKGATLRRGDFAEVTSIAKRGDLVYFDPPYVSPTKRGIFSKYNKVVFTMDDQHRLAHEAERLQSIGCFVIVSNAYDPAIAALYRKTFNIERIERASVIAADAQHRRMTEEMLVFSRVGGS